MNDPGDKKGRQTHLKYFLFLFPSFRDARWVLFLERCSDGKEIKENRGLDPRSKFLAIYFPRRRQWYIGNETSLPWKFFSSSCSFFGSRTKFVIHDFIHFSFLWVRVWYNGFFCHVSFPFVIFSGVQWPFASLVWSTSRAHFMSWLIFEPFTHLQPWKRWQMVLNQESDTGTEAMSSIQCGKQWQQNKEHNRKRCWRSNRGAQKRIFLWKWFSPFVSFLFLCFH